MDVTRFLLSPLNAVRRWPTDSQLGARRNAMIAATALAQRRAEIEEVEAFLAGRHRMPTLPTTDDTAPHSAHG